MKISNVISEIAHIMKGINNDYDGRCDHIIIELRTFVHNKTQQ